MSTKTENRQSALKRRVQQFYKLLSQGDFARCHRMIDPRVLAKSSSITLLQYETSLREFLCQFGTIRVVDVTLDLHLNEPSKLYEGRDFALGKTIWADQAGDPHVFAERWVSEEGAWYTRSTGLLVPSTTETTPPISQAKTVASGKPVRRVIDRKLNRR